MSACLVHDYHISCYQNILVNLNVSGLLEVKDVSFYLLSYKANLSGSLWDLIKQTLEKYLLLGCGNRGQDFS